MKRLLNTFFTSILFIEINDFRFHGFPNKKKSMISLYKLFWRTDRLYKPEDKYISLKVRQFSQTRNYLARAINYCSTVMLVFRISWKLLRNYGFTHRKCNFNLEAWKKSYVPQRWNRAKCIINVNIGTQYWTISVILVS